MLEDHYITAESICGSLMEGVIIAAANAEFLYWNGTARYLMGNKMRDVPPEEWAREYGILDLKGERYLNREELPLSRALSGEEFHEERFLTKNVNFPDGIILSVSGKPLRSGEATVGAILTFKDISQQIAVERNLREENSQFLNTIDNMPGYVYIKDLDSKYIYGNKNFRKILGVDSVTGKQTSDFFSNDLTETIKEHDRYVLETKTAKTFEEIFYWKDHRRSVFLTSRFPFRDSKNEIRGICVVANDITEFVSSNEPIRKDSNLELTKMAVTGKIAFEVSQQVVEPIRALRDLGLEIVSDLNRESFDLEALKDKFKKVEGMITKVHAAADTIDHLENMDRNFCLEKASLKEVFNIIESLFRTQLLSLKVDWDTTDLKKNEEEEVSDKIHYIEVITNMVILALQAVQRCSQRRISITCKVTANDLMLTLLHSCEGRNPVGITTVEGLSWSICQSIVQKKGWQIDYRNVQNQGQIQLVLPRMG